VQAAALQREAEYAPPFGGNATRGDAPGRTGGRGGGRRSGRGRNGGRGRQNGDDDGTNGTPAATPMAASAVVRTAAAADPRAIDVNSLFKGTAPLTAAVTRNARETSEAAQREAACPPSPLGAPTAAAGSEVANDAPATERPGVSFDPELARILKPLNVPASAGTDTQSRAEARSPGVGAPSAPAAQTAETEPTGNKKPARKGLKRRPTFRKDGGDTCGEPDSEAIMKRKAQAHEQLADLQQWQALPDRVTKALLRSHMVWSLADMIALLRHQRLSQLLLELGEVLETRQEALTGSLQAQDAFICSALIDDVRARDAAPTVAIAEAMYVRTVAQYDLEHSYRAAAQSQRAYDQTGGKPQTWPCEMATMRRTNVALSADRNAATLTAAFDEGSEVDCITADALSRMQTDFAAGYAPFNEREDIGPPQVLCMAQPLQIRSFNGSDARCGCVALVHMRIGGAMYPVRLVVVKTAPADVVLGCAFMHKYCRRPPYALYAQRTHLDEISTVCLGVPAGFACATPKWMRSAGDGPPQLPQKAFTQQLRLRTEWRPWPLKGKVVPTSEAVRFVNKFL